MVQLATTPSSPPPFDDEDLRWAHALDAEASVIGGLLLDNSAYDRVADLVEPAHFYSRQHRLIFEHVMAMIEQARPVDALTLAECMQRDGTLAEVGGQAFIGSLALNTPSAVNIRRYAELVRERAIFRHVVSECTALIDAVRRPGKRDAQEILDLAQARMLQIGERAALKSEFVESGAVMAEAAAFIDQQYSRDDDSGVTGLATGFVDLDQMTSGLQAGQLVVLAARPSMGKSTLALNICCNVAARKIPAAFLSLEMRNREQALRLIAAGARLNTQRLFSGRLKEAEWPRIVDAVGRLSDMPLLFNDASYLTIMELRAMMRRLKRQQPKLGLVVVDYLQLMVAGSGSDHNRANQIAEISRGLKLLAKELQVPVLALSQLNREVDKRANRRPTMSDLRESGAIEQDADVVMFIYRDEVYDEASPHRGTAEIIIAKQRNGPVGTIKLAFRADHTLFENYAGGGNA